RILRILISWNVLVQVLRFPRSIGRPCTHRALAAIPTTRSTANCWQRSLINRFPEISMKEIPMDQTQQEKNKALVLEAFNTLFNKRDYEKAAKFWSPNYIQHSAHIPPGRDGLFGLVRVIPNSLQYENHLILAEGNDVMLHGRFTGHSSPRPWLAADRLRLEGGLLAGHWAVLAAEPRKAESASGLPAIGDSFASPDQPPTAVLIASSLTAEEARKITAPLYDALNQPAKKDVSALLAQATLPDYRSYHKNEEYRSR